MPNDLGRCWRIFGTGLSFALFGAGGLLLRIFVFPVINLLVRDRKKCIRVSRQVIRVSFFFFIWIMSSLRVLRYSVSGIERLDRNGLLIVANHPTLIDTIFLIAFTRHADCIVKSELWRNPFTRGPIHAASYINNEDSNALIDNCIASLEGGSNLIIFPEGTRTSDDGVIRLKRGAANIAVRGRRNITPVIINCSPPTLGKNTKWWQVPKHWAHFQIEVKEDIDVTAFVEKSTTETLAVRRLTNHMENYFNQEHRRENHGFA